MGDIGAPDRIEESEPFPEEVPVPAPSPVPEREKEPA